MTRLLIILDLDETLVYAAEQPLERPCDFRAGAGYHVYLRPHVGTFLGACLEEFDLAVWSSAGADYVAQVVGRLFAEPSRLRFAWSGERCTRRSSPQVWCARSASRPRSSCCSSSTRAARFWASGDGRSVPRSSLTVGRPRAEVEAACTER